MVDGTTPYFIQLTYEAALKSFWRKEALRKFLRECSVAESHLASWSPDESKREFLDRTFASLQRTDRGQGVLRKMANFLSEQATFPDLLNWEDSNAKISAASKAVEELKSLLRRQADAAVSEKEKIKIREAAIARREMAKRAKTSLDSLASQLKSLVSQQGTSVGGYAFQDWFYDLLSFEELDTRKPYVTLGRQIDGSVTVDGTTYLVELKFTSEQAGAPDIDVFRSKIESKADNTMGIFVSMSGYSSVAISEASGKKTTMLLLDASHVFLALSGTMQLAAVIRRVRRHASQTGESYLSVDSFGG